LLITFFPAGLSVGGYGSSLPGRISVIEYEFGAGYFSSIIGFLAITE
jgi:hypothetical protein